MRDYSIARSLFTFLEIALWVGVVTGVIIAAGSIGVSSRAFGAPTGIVAAIPGILIGLFSLLGVAIVQMGRATVDTAEYGQQMLKVARDQLDVSRQAIKQGSGLENSFADLARRVTASAEEPIVGVQEGGYEALHQIKKGASKDTTTPKVENDNPKPYANQLGANPAAKQELLTYDINGQKLTQNPDGTFDFEGNRFESLDAFKERNRLK